ncbi:F-box only protein 47 [Rhinophrynus dorsalis]
MVRESVFGIKEISILGMVSKAICRHLISYISSPAGSRRLLLQDFHTSEISEMKEGTSILDHYRSLGLLFKRCTLLLPTKERLKYIHKSLLEVPCLKLCGCTCPHIEQCLGLPCYGAFLQNLTAGWDELECHRVYNFLCDLTNLPQKMHSLVSGKPGSARKLELRVRLFCRSVLLDHWTQRRDSVFWLSRLLKPWPFVTQARLLYIIFGPVSALDGHVSWINMTERMADESSLKGLVDAIKLLYSTDAKAWSTDDVISLLDELSVIPREWRLENTARFLILSGSSICFSFMASKAVNGRSMDIARIVVFLAFVCEKDLYCMNWAVKMMQRVCTVFGTQTEKRTFLQNVEAAFSRNIMAMMQALVSGDSVKNELVAVLSKVLKANAYLTESAFDVTRFSGVRDDEAGSFLNIFHLVNAQANFHKEILYLTLNCPSV